MLEVEKTKLDGILLIKPSTIFEDFRGSYIELYNEEFFHEAGIKVKFVQDDISTSAKNVLRGVHGDTKTWKLVSCLWGSFYLLVLNWDAASPQYGQWDAFTLSDKNRHQILIPPKFGNGHVVLTEHAIFHYKQSTSYDRAGQFTVLWDDPRLKLEWPVTNPILSKRDKGENT